jgi:NAD(P)-dependent dehydrogenase (short-subunit alcohol dehydrogenase family)
MGYLAGTVVVITGAARGIGRAIAEDLGQGGAKVVVNYVHSKGEESHRRGLEQGDSERPEWQFLHRQSRLALFYPAEWRQDHQHQFDERPGRELWPGQL